MSDDQAPESDPQEAQPGVLGSLPRRRPGVRSPRRAEAAARADRSPPEGPGTGKPEARAGEESGGVEDLVRAGATVAAEAAAIGLRLAGQALRGIRGSADKR